MEETEVSTVKRISSKPFYLIFPINLTSITSILNFKFSSYSISFKSYGVLKLSEKGCLGDKIHHLLPLGPWRENKDIF